MLESLLDNTGPKQAKQWRLALLVTTLMMGAALGMTSYSSYLQAKRHAETLARSEVSALMKGLRREIRGAGIESEINAYLKDAESEGLHYIGFLNRQGHLVKEFGRHLKPFPSKLLRFDGEGRGRRRGPGPMEMVVFKDGLVHAKFPIPRRMRIERLTTHSHLPVGILVEVKSNEGVAMVESAVFSLTISIGAALLLLGATILFWRLSLRQENLTEKMEADKLAMLKAFEEDKRLKSLGRMSAVLGHELKNPIAALKGHAQLLCEKLDVAESGYKQAETVLQEALLLERLTHEILEYVRTGQLTYSKVYLDDLAMSAVELSGAQPVDIVVPDNVAWYLDRRRMEQVLINLLSNARQSSTDNNPITLRFTVQDDTRLTIVVRDRGEGIDDEDMDQLFEPFFTRRVQGTGLGLPLAKQIVESHGGQITAMNPVDGGAQFTIILPNRSSSEEL